MRKFLTVMLAVCCMLGVSAQGISKKEQKRIEKEAKNEAKRLKEESPAWKTLPGSLTLQMQIEKSMEMAYETDQYGNKKYMIERGASIGSTYNAAKFGAIQAAKIEMASSIEQEYEGTIKNILDNDADAEVSVEKNIAAVTSKIAEKIGKVITVTEMYRELGPKRIEVAVTIAYDSEDARKVALEGARQALEEESRKLMD